MPRWSPDSLKPLLRAALGGLTSFSFGSAQGLDFAVYRRYRFELEGIRTAADDGNLWVRTSGDAGSTDYDRAGQSWASNDSSTINLNTGSGAAQLDLTAGGTGGGMGSVAANELGVSGTLFLEHGGSALAEPAFRWRVAYRNPSSNVLFVRACGYRRTTTQILSVDFLPSDGAAFEQGEISVYGYRKI